jgi:hypothetical protein
MKPLFIGIPIAAFFAWLLGGAVAPDPKEQDKQEQEKKRVEWQAPASEEASESEGLFEFPEINLPWKPLY